MEINAMIIFALDSRAELDISTRKGDKLDSTGRKGHNFFSMWHYRQQAKKMNAKNVFGRPKDQAIEAVNGFSINLINGLDFPKAINVAAAAA